MDALPIDSVLDAVVAEARRGAVVLQAPPGSGKTTRVPPALAEALPGRIVVLEPRRMAARAAARRVAAELGTRPGEGVGWHVRFDRKVSDATRIVFMTEGILLRQLAEDPFLDGVSAVVLDEFHERSVLADLALALVAAVRRDVRDDLSVVVMSATLDAAPVAAFLGCHALETHGTLYDVDVRYDPRPDSRRLEDRVADAVAEVAPPDGDVLVFLPGMAEIRRCEARLHDRRTRILHGSLPPEEQDAVLTPSREPRVILATNVAESSVTVPGVRAVVDTGIAKIARLDRATGLDRLDVLPIARDSADQRAGRAGRLGPGVCRRLWTAMDHRDRPDHGAPEIHRTDLAGAVLALLDFGEPDPFAFAWFDPPARAALVDAMALLEALGAVADGALTPLGREMARLPLHPRLARFLIEAHRRGATDRAAALVAWMSEGGRPEGDLEHQEVPGHTQRLASRLVRGLRGPSGPRDPDAIARAALCAWPDRVAKQRGEGAVMVGGIGVRGGHTPLFVAIAVDPARRSERGEWHVTLQTRVDPAWLDATSRVVVRFDPDSRRVVAVQQERAGLLVLGERPAPRPSTEVARPILFEAARDDWERVLPKNDRDWDRLVGRLKWVAAHQPHPGLPDGSPASLEPVLDALCAKADGFDALRKAPWRGTLLDLLPWEARKALDERAPESLQLARGRPLRVDYPDGRPVLAARIQQLFGTRETPRICGEPVLLHLLAPNGRPQQITTDLAGFWASTYFEVRKELRRRYPKHDWPDDPV
ncbi:MAG: ATP-dependent helicase HrpB [Alphaproteobacteria bacterium]|nr:ATP-dependent helicase HrpB [Alphaproteobacteria bacterium]